MGFKKWKMTETMAADIINANKLKMGVIVNKINNEFTTIGLQNMRQLKDEHSDLRDENDELYKFLEKEREERNLK